MQKQTNRRKVYQLNLLGYEGCRDFGHYHYNTVEPILSEHSHSDILEICYCLKGQQYYEIDGQISKLTGNNILIVPPDIPHSSGVYPEDIGELFWLQLSVKNNETLCNLSSGQSKYLLNKLTLNGSKLFKGAFQVKNTLENLEELLSEPTTTFSQLRISQLIVQLLIDTLVLSEEPQQIADSERMEIIKSFIGMNLHRIIYVDELATLVNFSIPHLKSWFKQNFGAPPRAYINRLKIEKAKSDLAELKTITAVAFELGFGSSQYFATTFKKYTGISPKIYKASL